MSDIDPIKTNPPVYLVDDDTDFRDSLEALLKLIGWQVSSFSSGSSFLKVLDSLPPGLVLLDIRMPIVSGMQLLEQLRDRKTFPTIMMTGHGDIPAAVRAMRLGAVEFLEKPFAESNLVTALSQASLVLEAALDQFGRASINRDLWRQLTRREGQVLKLLIAGYSNKQMAFELGISVRTVEMHRKSMLGRLGVRNSAEAIRIGLSPGQLKTSTS